MTKILVSEDGTVVFFEEGKPISQMTGGVIIKCKKCGREELVVKGSFCDFLKLCIEDAREELKRRGIIK
jgi:hypothetical protein